MDEDRKGNRWRRGAVAVAVCAAWLGTVGALVLASAAAGPGGGGGVLRSRPCDLGALPVAAGCYAAAPVAGGYSPVAPSNISRTRSAWPQWRAVSSTMWVRIQPSERARSGRAAMSSQAAAATISRERAHSAR